MTTDPSTAAGAYDDTVPLVPTPPTAAPPGVARQRGSRTGSYAVLALGLVAAAAPLPFLTTLLLAGDIAASTGTSRGALVSILVLATAAAAAIALPLAGLAERTGLRDAIAVAGAWWWAVGLVLIGLLDSAGPFTLLLVVTGAATVTVRVVHEPLLLAAVERRAQPTAMAAHWGAGLLGIAVTAAAVAGLSTVLSWRGAVLVLGVVGLVVAGVATRLRDPGGEEERPVEKGDGVVADTVAAELGVIEISRRVLLVPTVRSAMGPIAAAGLLLLPLQVVCLSFLAWRWGVGGGGAALGLALLHLAAATTALRVSLAGRAVSAAQRLLGARRAAAVGLVGVVLGPFLPAAVPALLVVGLGAGAVLGLQPVLLLPALRSVPTRMRAHVAALAGIALLAGGGAAGLAYVGLIAPRFGPDVGIAMLALPVAAALPAVRRMAACVEEDLDRREQELREARAVLSSTASPGPKRLLEVRHLDFAYGQLQVLFGVDMVMDEGEVVALLGTNGAGKSTLLRVISGLGLPSRGTVTFDGLDVTHLDAERRLPLGLSQIPGGKAVFGPLSVLDNLRVYGHSLGRDQDAVEAGIEATFAAFPRLHDRSSQTAATLSGGEQQMLALGKALMLQPKLLLVDELSLGLAPKVVGELLEMVRTINAAGTAVVLVEQSVNIALSLAERAYFMEKGEVRFEGPSQELLERPDILRSVFLEGAAKGIATPAP